MDLSLYILKLFVSIDNYFIVNLFLINFNKINLKVFEHFIHVYLNKIDFLTDKFLEETF